MSALDQIASRIIKEQELIIGPIAWNAARKVSGLQISDEQTGSVVVDSAKGSAIVDALVYEYETLFGRASREVCREAVAGLLADLPREEVPQSLR